MTRTDVSWIHHPEFVFSNITTSLKLLHRPIARRSEAQIPKSIQSQLIVIPKKFRVCSACSILSGSR